jgi:hypothetical protein
VARSDPPEYARKGKWTYNEGRQAILRLGAGPRGQRYSLSWHDATAILNDVLDELVTLRSEGVRCCNQCRIVVSDVETCDCRDRELVSANYLKMQDLEWQVEYLLSRNEALEEAVKAFSQFPASTG